MTASRRDALLVVAGLIVRVAAWANMGYLDNDDHLSVVAAVAKTWRPVHADQLGQGFHPPLYYFLAAPFYAMGGAFAVHLLSLALSCATLALVAVLVRRLPWLSAAGRSWALAFAALHPQFVLFGLFISNDALAFPVGVLAFLQARRLQESPSTWNHALLGLIVGCGLLTKASFLAFLIPLAAFIVWDGRRRGAAARAAFAMTATFLAIAVALGAYKFVESELLYGKPMISNLELAQWPALQRPTWIGPLSIVDFNVAKIVAAPVVTPATVHSYPLMLYASFWYAFIPESSFRGNVTFPYDRIGSALYLFALVPTALILIGAWRIACRAREGDERAVFEATTLAVLALNFALVLFTGIRSDVWSVFQGRLLFPSYAAILLALAAGYDAAARRGVSLRFIRGAMGVVVALFIIYFAAEIPLARTAPIEPLLTPHMAYQIDMHRR